MSTKKGGRKSEPTNAGDNNKYNEGDIVLGKIKGYPPWPGKIVNSENVPKGVSKEKPKKDNIYAIRFYPTAEYMWATPKDLSLLSNDEIESFLNDGSKKRDGQLREGYQIALNPTEWEELQDKALAEYNEADEQEEEADELEDEEDAGSKRRRKSDAKGANAKKAKTEKGTQKKSQNKKGKNEEEEETSKNKKESMSEDEGTRVKSWRHELQRIFLSPEPAKPDQIEKADQQLKIIENDNEISVNSILSSKLNKVLKRIIGLETISRDEEFNIRSRSQALYERFEKMINGDNQHPQQPNDEKKNENGEDVKMNESEPTKQESENKEENPKPDAENEKKEEENPKQDGEDEKKEENPKPDAENEKEEEKPKQDGEDEKKEEETPKQDDEDEKKEIEQSKPDGEDVKNVEQPNPENKESENEPSEQPIPQEQPVTEQQTTEEKKE